jgi:(4S)-4-hydroxy-5-phosphonooxypentane-2,3-dione isomerase
MIVQSIHFTFAPEDADRADQMLRELSEASREEEGVAGFDVVRSRENPNVFALWEQYRDQAAFDSHKMTEHFTRLVIGGVRKLARERNAVLGSAG